MEKRALPFEQNIDGVWHWMPSNKELLPGYSIRVAECDHHPDQGMLFSDTD